MGFFQKLFGGGGSSKIEEAIQNGAIIIDVRTKQEFNKGHIDGAVNIPLQQIPKQLKKIKSKNKPIVLCCRSGGRAGSALQHLESAGIEAYNGGGWTSLRKLV